MKTHGPAVHLTSWYPTKEQPSHGIYIQRHILALAKRSPQAVVVLSPGTFHPGRVSLETRPTETDQLDTWSLSIGNSDVERMVAMTLSAKPLARFLREIDPQLIHVHVFNALPLAVPLARELGLPLCYTEHSTSFCPSSPHRLQYLPSRLFGALARRTSATSAVSPFLANRMESIFKLSDSPQITPNIVAEEFKPRSIQASDLPNRPIKLMTVASLTKVKRWDVLLTAVELLSDLNIELLVVGDGPDKDSFAAAVKQLGLGSRVKHELSLEPQQIAAELGSSTVYVHTADAETFSVAIAEAVRVGVPVVAARSGGPESWLSGPGVSFVPAGDPALVANAIRTSVKSPRSPVWPQFLDLDQVTASLEHLHTTAVSNYGADSTNLPDREISWPAC